MPAGSGRRHQRQQGRRFVLDDRREGRDVGFRVSETGDGGANRGRVQQRKVALQIDDRVVSAAGVETHDRLVDAVGAGGLAPICHHGTPSDLLDRVGNGAVAAGNNNRPDLGGDGAPPDMDDHWRSGDVGERFARQTRCGEAGGNDDDRVFG